MSEISAKKESIESTNQNISHIKAGGLQQQETTQDVTQVISKQLFDGTVHPCSSNKNLN